MNWTSGPWTAGRKVLDGKVTWNRETVYGPEGDVVAVCKYTRDAVLVAAAPRLLEALGKVLRVDPGPQPVMVKALEWLLDSPEWREARHLIEEVMACKID